MSVRSRESQRKELSQHMQARVARVVAMVGTLTFTTVPSAFLPPATRKARGKGACSGGKAFLSACFAAEARGW